MRVSSNTSFFPSDMGTCRDTVEFASPQVKCECPHTPCFTEGTEIATDRGPVAIEDLRLGDRVLTRDNGYRQIRWIGARQFDAQTLRAYPQLQPVTIRAGALAADLPLRDLTVSPQHRMLLTDPAAAEGETEVLVAAIDLRSCERSSQREVTYYHIMFDAHEIVSANGCWSESFLADAEALDGLHSAQRDEILMIFPELATEAGLRNFAPARLCLDRAEQPVAKAA